MRRSIDGRRRPQDLAGTSTGNQSARRGFTFAAVLARRSVICLRSKSTITNRARNNMNGLVGLPPNVVLNKPFTVKFAYNASDPTARRYACVLRGSRGARARKADAPRIERKMLRRIMR